MSTNTEFLQHLESRIAPHNLLKHPFYQAWTAGELTQEDLRDYAAEYWHQVSAFPTYLSALHARLEDTELRRTVLRNLLDEEGFDAPDRRPHSSLWMDFARGSGATESEVRERKIQPEMAASLETFRGLMREGTPAAALAALYAYESQVPEIAKQKAAGLREHYGADDTTRRYFTLHQTADVKHTAVWKRAIAEEVVRDPQSEAAALDAAENAARALWGALDGVERLRLERRAN